jgi:hypothetical protein
MKIDNNLEKFNNLPEFTASDGRTVEDYSDLHEKLLKVAEDVGGEELLVKVLATVACKDQGASTVPNYPKHGLTVLLEHYPDNLDYL